MSRAESYTQTTLLPREGGGLRQSYPSSPEAPAFAGEQGIAGGNRQSSLAALVSREEDGGFRQDLRFAKEEARTPHRKEIAAADAMADPVADAFAQGFLQGSEQAQADAAAATEAEAQARAALDLAFTRLDADMAEDLRQRLSETVLALCDAMLAPIALDPAALAQRIERAVAMLARADDERVIRLNPQDIALVAPRLAQDLTLLADAALPRGHVRIETANGGVEDGPAQWRRALAEALCQC